MTMEKGKTVWFWTNDLEIFNGDISLILCFNMEKPPVAKIRSNGIHLGRERLYKTEGECISALREKRLNELLEDK